KAVAAAVQCEPGEDKRKKGGMNASLVAITFLKKLCNSPQLAYDMILENVKKSKGDRSASSGLEELLKYFPKEFEQCRQVLVPTSGKLVVLDTLLAFIKNETNDKVVLVSNYTQTLDLFERLCRMRNYRYVRLDGTMSIKKRGSVVENFNDPLSND